MYLRINLCQIYSTFIHNKLVNLIGPLLSLSIDLPNYPVTISVSELQNSSNTHLLSDKKEDSLCVGYIIFKFFLGYKISYPTKGLINIG